MNTISVIHNKILLSTIPNGQYIAVTDNGIIGFTVSAGYILFNCVLIDFTTNAVTVGATHTLASLFTNVTCYKIK